MEDWVPVVGFEGKYLINKQGIIKHYKKRKPLRPFKDRYGYHCVNLVVGNLVRKRCYVHRLVAFSFLGGNKKLTVNHIDEVKTNNNLVNLELVPNKVNVKKWWANHAKFRPAAKLKEEEVITIRRLLSADKSTREIAKMFKVTDMTVINIKTGRTWKHLTEA